jgi:hypothetical protein
MREWLRRAKDKPCADCGHSFPSYVMDFHHRDPSTKLFGIGDAPRGKQQLIAEVAKCDVICANCHRERDHSQGSGERI